VRLHAAAGRTLRAITADEVRADRWRERVPAAAGETAPPGPIPWRPGAMKILICDLLFATDPSALLVPLAAGAGAGVVLAPALADEAELPWRGNVELTDCENETVRRQRVDEPLAARYAAAYTRHFALWREASRRRGVLFARVPCEGALATALSGEAFAAGAVEAVA